MIYKDEKLAGRLKLEKDSNNSEVVLLKRKKFDENTGEELGFIKNERLTVQEIDRKISVHKKAIDGTAEHKKRITDLNLLKADIIELLSDV